MTPYADETYATSYFSERLRTAPWDDTTESSGDRTKALIEATRLIDRLNFYGTKTSATQENEFPRNGETTTPDYIKYACCEIAIRLLDDIDPDQEIENLALKSQGVSSVRSTYDRDFVLECFRAGIPSPIAWSYLKPYLADARTIILSRV
jgi:hypothetical protein